MHIDGGSADASSLGAAVLPGLAAGQTPNRVCILVLGMHRSGTSAVTKSIGALGPTLPKHLFAPDENNPTGYWEPALLNDLNERLLIENGSRWDDWRAFDAGQLPPERMDYFRTQVCSRIHTEYGDAPSFVLKEPRISRFVPMYRDLLQEMGIEVRYALAHRNPYAVIGSLEKRDGLDRRMAALLWLRHELDAERSTRGGKRFFLSYEALLGDHLPVMKRLANALDLHWPDVDEELFGHLSADHQHNLGDIDIPDADPLLREWLDRAYAALRALEDNSGDERAMLELDSIRQLFDGMSSVVGDLFFSEIARRDALFRKLEDKLAIQSDALVVSSVDTDLIGDIRKSQSESLSIISDLLNDVSTLKHQLDENNELLRTVLNSGRDRDRGAMFSAVGRLFGRIRGRAVE